MCREGKVNLWSRAQCIVSLDLREYKHVQRERKKKRREKRVLIEEEELDMGYVVVDGSNVQRSVW